MIDVQSLLLNKPHDTIDGPMESQCKKQMRIENLYFKLIRWIPAPFCDYDIEDYFKSNEEDSK